MMWSVLFFKQKTAYERRISDWSSDVCSSDPRAARPAGTSKITTRSGTWTWGAARPSPPISARVSSMSLTRLWISGAVGSATGAALRRRTGRSEEHTSELQSLMRISYAVFCLKTKKSHSQHFLLYYQHVNTQQTPP